MGSTRVDYVDSDGIRRRVLLPANAGADPTEGIPLSVPVDSLYAHMPPSFRKDLIEALWAVGLIEADDYFKPGAVERIRAALLSVVKRDTMDILKLAREMKNGK